MEINRDNEIKKIKDQRDKGNTTIILYGPGGYGKTTIAKEYNNGTTAKNEIINVEGSNYRVALERIYTRIALRCNNGEELIKEVSSLRDDTLAALTYKKLDKVYSSWCIVYDNVLISGHGFFEFINKIRLDNHTGTFGTVLVTTKYLPQDEALHENGIASIRIQAVTDKIARDFLKNSFPEITESDIQLIKKVTGFIVLPLKMAVNAIDRMQGKNLSEKIHSFCEKINDVNAPNGSREYGKNLYKATVTTVNMIKNDEEYGHSAYELMMSCALLSYAPFSRKRDILYNLQIENVLNTESYLQDWSIINPGNEIIMHPTTQEILTFIDCREDSEAYISRVLRVTTAFVEVATDSSHPNVIQIEYDEVDTAKRLIKSLESIIGKISNNQDLKTALQRVYEISYGLAYFFWKTKSLACFRVEYYEHAYKAIKELTFFEPTLENRYLAAAQLRYKGPALRQMDRNKEAIECYNQVILAYQVLLPEEKTHEWNKLAMEAFYDRGLVKSDEGITTEVKTDFENSLRIAKEAGLDLSIPYRCLGIYYRNTNKLKIAEKMFNQSLKGGDADNKARCYTNIGLLYYMMNKWEKAIEYYQEALRIHHENNNDTEVKALLYMTDCYLKLGDNEKARDQLEKATWVLFGDAPESTANVMIRILRGETIKLDLHEDDEHWSNIDCMLYCTKCVSFLLAYDHANIPVDNCRQLLNLAFSIRGDAFLSIQEKLMNCAKTLDEWTNYSKEQIRMIFSDFLYNKRSCAMLLMTCCRFFDAQEDYLTALVFIHAAKCLFSADNYQYGTMLADKVEKSIEALV